MAAENKKNRMTQQRRVILEELRRVRSHPSADELYMIIRKKLPKISLGTVYRNLDFLSRKGLVRRLVIPGQPMRFDGEIAHHHHIRCQYCGTIDDICLDIPLGEILQMKTIGRFVLIGYNLELVGICPSCSRDKSGVLREGAA